MTMTVILGVKWSSEEEYFTIGNECSCAHIKCAIVTIIILKYIEI